MYGLIWKLDAHRAYLRGLIAATPDLTISEMQERLLVERGCTPRPEAGGLPRPQRADAQRPSAYAAE
jgi:hypothetical protein